MKPEFLYQLIQGLDVQQKSIFREWVAKNTRKGQSMPKFLLLYRRMLNAKVFDEVQIRKDHLEKPTAYYKSRELLLSKLILCFSEEKQGEKSSFVQMTSAVELGAFDHAKVLFAQELTESTQRGDVATTFQLAVFREALLQDFNFDLGKGLELDSSRQIQSRIRFSCEAEDLIAKTRSLFRSRAGNRAEMLLEIENFLAGIEDENLLDSYLHLKLSIFRYYLTDQPERAAALQISMADQLIAGDLVVRNVQRLKEVSAAILSCFLQGNRDKATELALHFSKLPAQGPMEMGLKSKLKTLRTIELGFVLGHADITRSGIALLAEHKEGLEPQFYHWYTYVAGLSCLYQGDLNTGHRLIRELVSSGQAKTYGILWQVDVLDLLFHLEKMNWDYLESVLANKKRKFRHQPYPLLMIRFIEKLYLKQGQLDRLFLSQFQAALATLEYEIRTKGQSSFDLALYLEAKHDNIPIFLLQERKDELLPIPVQL